MSKTGPEDDARPEAHNTGDIAESMRRTTEIVAQISKATNEEALGQLWDEFWAVNPDAGVLGVAVTSFLVPILRQRQAMRILCVGNGMALEAHALAAAGFDVDSLDVSPEANRFLKELRVPREELERILREPSSENPGLPEIHTGDVRDADACPGPYDVVIARRILQYFEGDDLDVVMDALSARISGTGLLVFEDHNAKKVLRTAATWLSNRGIPVAWNLCMKDGAFFAAPVLGTSRDRRVAWLIRSSG